MLFPRRWEMLCANHPREMFCLESTLPSRPQGKEKRIRHFLLPKIVRAKWDRNASHSLRRGVNELFRVSHCPKHLRRRYIKHSQVDSLDLCQLGTVKTSSPNSVNRKYWTKSLSRNNFRKSAIKHNVKSVKRETKLVKPNKLKSILLEPHGNS